MAANYGYQIGRDTYYFNRRLEYQHAEGSTAIPSSNFQSYMYVSFAIQVNQGIVTWSRAIRLIQLVNLIYPNYIAYYSFNSKIDEKLRRDLISDIGLRTKGAMRS
jgi:hypothetical protein